MMQVSLSQKSDDGVRLLCYIAQDGSCPVEDWRSRQTLPVQAAMDATLESLEVIPSRWWRRKRFAKLGKRGQRECSGLGEIILQVDGVHYRVFGYFDAGETVFTLLVGFKKDDDPDYSKTCPEAQRRRSEIEDGVAKTKPLFGG